MFSPHFFLRQVPESITSKRTIILALLATVLCAISLWVGLPQAHSAPGKYASPPPPPLPVVTIAVPGEVLVGEDFQFKVTFKNDTGADVGYGPYIELYLPARGADSNGLDNISVTNQKCDGISFLSASTSFANPPTITLPPVYNSLLSISSSDLKCPKPYNLPWADMTYVAAAPSPDYQLVVIELPFGSFDPSQPEIVVNVTAHVSDFADVDPPALPPLTIYARGGFRYGDDALDNPPQILEAAPVSGQINPKVFKLKKRYFGPEDEAVSGPNFINYYPLKYQLTADIADKQKIHNLVITDNLPGKLQFAGNVQVKKGNPPIPAIPITSCSSTSGPDDVVISTPPTSLSPNGTVSVKLCSPITGTTASDDVVITFDFFIPELDDNGKEILEKDCKNSPELVKNDILATGDWDPLDPRDPTLASLAGTTVPINSNLTNPDHVLLAKCLAIQKKVTQHPPDTPGPGLTPDDTLRYELNFQVSDYKSIGKIIITDLLADGQLLVGPPPTLTVSDQFGSYNTTFDAATSSATFDSSISCNGITGGTRLTFNVSAALVAAAGSGGPPSLQNGILTGGWAAGPPSTVPAHGQIIFYAQIQDKFKYQVPQNDPKESVDKYDPLNNCVSIEGLVYQNEVKPTVPSITLSNTTDGSGSQVRIAMEKPKKTVYAVKRANDSIICGPSPNTACHNLPGTPQDVHPGDKVTFRIEYPIPSGDAEDLKIEDWLPLPVFDVGDPDATPPAGLPTWPTAVPWCTGPAPYVPTPGMACGLTPLQATPGHTLQPPLSLLPGTANDLLFTYGTVFNTANTSMNIDLLFTLTVTNQPFADGLFLTNEAREKENNTFGPAPPQVTIAQVNLREPKLRIRKGVIATNNLNGQFSHPASPPTTPPTALAPPNATLSLTGISGTSPMLSSNDLATATGILDSNLPAGVDANDIVTFAITVENVGGAPAYDVKIEDIIPHDINGNPTCFTIVPNTIKVKRGTGATVLPFLYNIVPAVPTTTGFTITSTSNPFASIAAYHPTNGANIIVITFQAKLLANIMPGCCDNKAEIKHYASQLNGPDFVSAGFTPPFEDSAQVCVKPTLTKSMVATSEAHTAGSNVAIGEIVRYGLAIQLPETGLLPNFEITDALPAGLKFLNDGTARIAFVSNQVPIMRTPLLPSAYTIFGNSLPASALLTTKPPIPSAVFPGVGGCGSPVTFKLGNVKNNDNDPDLEYIVIEFNALVCNVPGNQDATPLPNTFSVSSNGNLIDISNSLNLQVVEPNLVISKVASPATVAQGGTVTYTVTITNTGTAHAFDVNFTDVLPSGLTFVPFSVGVIGSCLPGPGVSVGAPLVMCAKVPTNGVMTITYKAVANPPLPCATCLTTLTNHARVTWTSLPGNGTPVGVNNTTGSITPGASGQGDGERNGVTAPPSLNDYAATASATLTVTGPPCAQAPQGMVAWWPLDETAGTMVSDIAGNIPSNPGTTMPGAINIGGPNSLLGEVNNGFLFCGQPASRFVTVADQMALNFGTAQNFSIDAWIKTSSTSQLQMIVDKLNWPNPNAGYRFYVDNTNRLKLDIGAGAAFTSANPVVLTPGTWYHVAVTVDRANPFVTFYINGTPDQAAGTPNSNASSPGLNLLIGGTHETPLVPLEGCNYMLDEVEIFKRALTQSEIDLIYRAGCTGKCKCSLATNEKVTCNSNGTFNYTFTFTNLSNAAVSNLVFSPVTSNVTITPTSMTIPLLASGGSTNVTVTIGGPGAVSGANVCFSVGLGGPLGSLVSCKTEHCITLPTCQASACATPPPGMVAWWPLDETSWATTVTDIIGANNGTPQPGPLGPIGPSNSGPLPGIYSGVAPPAMVGGSLYFYGNRFVRVPNASAPSLNFGAGDFTIDAWVYPIPMGPTLVQPIVDKLELVSSPAGGIGYRLFIRNGQLHFVLLDGLTSVDTQAPITSGQWHHVAVVRKGGTPNTVEVYIGGQLVSTSTPVVSNTSNTADLLIGGIVNSPGIGGLPSPIIYGNLSIDELEIFNRALAQPEIDRIYRAGSAGKCKCFFATNEKVSCNPDGTFNYTFTLTNLSNSTVSNLVLLPVASNVTITPALMTIPPLAPGDSTNVTVTIGGPGAVSGANVCFSFGPGGSIYANTPIGCRTEHCIKLPTCPATGSLTVTKIVKNQWAMPFPAGTNFPITVSCLPSGPTVTLNLAAGGTQTVNNIPVGSTCTVTEGALPPPIPHPACASLGWGTPTYAPGQTVTIPNTGGSQTVTVTNTYLCNTGSACASPPDKMVSWWPLNEQAGATVVTDIKGGHNGTPISGSLMSGQPGKVGGALFVGDNVSVPNDASLQFGTGNFSVDAWFAIAEPKFIAGIVDKLDILAKKGYALYVENDHLKFVMGNGTSFVTYTSSAPVGLVPGVMTWHHVAVTVNRSGGLSTFYIDGKSAGTFTALPIAVNIATTSALLIGGSRQTFFTPFPPTCACEYLLDEVEIFNDVLSASDIKAIYDAGSAGKCTAGVHGKKFNDLNQNKVPDAGEPGLSGWTIQVTDQGGNIQSTTTDAQGNYSFTVPAPGTYTLSEVNQNGWFPTTSSRTITVSANGSADVNFGNTTMRRGGFTFTPGMNEFCIWGGGGPFYSPTPIDNPNLGPLPGIPTSQTPIGNTGGKRFGTIGLCYGRILWANDQVAFKYTFNAIPVAVLSYPDVNPVFIDRPFLFPVSETRRNVFGAGLSPIGFQLYFRPQSRVKPFVNISGGFIFFNDPVPLLNGAQFNFTFDFGGGVQVFRDSGRAFTFGYKYQHISNGGRALNNPGFDGHVFYFGYSIFKAPQKAPSPQPEIKE